MTPHFTNRLTARRQGFTLIELLVVISIIGVLATFTIVGTKAIVKNRKISVAKGELAVLAAALDNYKAKYGVYPPGNGYGNPMLSQLYYELSGTSKTPAVNPVDFTTLDGVASIPIASVNTAYKVGGFINCTKGSGEDAAAAKNFLPNLSSKQLNNAVTNNGVRTTMIVTSVGGPDATYQPLGTVDLNPIRYAYPGTNNVDGYDLWVQLQIGGTKYLVSNWSKAAQVNTSYP